MSFVPIATKCNGPVEAAYVSIDDDRYDVAECGAAQGPNWTSHIFRIIRMLYLMKRIIYAIIGHYYDIWIMVSKKWHRLEEISSSRRWCM